MKPTIVYVALCVTLAGCSTGNIAIQQPVSLSNGPSLMSAGVYDGAFSTGGMATLLMLYDGTAILFHSAAKGTGVQGVVVVASGFQSASGIYESGRALDFTLDRVGVLPVTLRVDFSQAPAISGTVQHDADITIMFNAQANQMLGQTPALSTIAGLYSGRASSLGGSASGQITVTANGYLAGTTQAGCVFKGTVAPHAGLNAYDVIVTFGPSPCLSPMDTVSGNAVLNQGRLLAALPKIDGSDVFVFDGKN
jgi:hypothetical protein